MEQPNLHLTLEQDASILADFYSGVDKWSEYKDYWETGAFPSIEIDYLAVRKEYRGQHIGTDIISTIKSFKDKTYAYHQPLFISVNAYCTKDYSAVGFYQKCYFWAAEFLNPNTETIRMYRTLS